MDKRIKRVESTLKRLRFISSESSSGEFTIWSNKYGTIIFPIPKVYNRKFKFYESLVTEYLMKDENIKVGDAVYYPAYGTIKSDVVIGIDSYRVDLGWRSIPHAGVALSKEVLHKKMLGRIKENYKKEMDNLKELFK